MMISQLEILIGLLKSKGIRFNIGLTDQEMLQVEQKFDLTFPPDLKQFLKTALPISKDFYDWRKALEMEEISKEIQSILAWPLEGVLFDIEHNNFWYDQWGEKPYTLTEKFEVARQHFVNYPKLVPVFSHRYIPSNPNIEGNPVFSVYQTGIIYYGYDLATYFANEFNFKLVDSFEMLVGPKRSIDFWTWCVENN